MKLVSFEADGRVSFGAVEGDKVIDLGPRMKDINGLENLLDPQSQARAADAAKGATADFNLDQIRFRRPIAYPEKIVCIGVNYANRGAEYNDDSTPTYPSVFLRAPETLVAHNEPLLLPPESVQLDYEAEIAIIIGEGGRRIPTDNALDHIAAVTCLNEGCIRDWMRHGKFNVTQGKNFDACGSVGGAPGRHHGQYHFRFHLPDQLRLDLDQPEEGRHHFDRHPDRRRRQVRPAEMAQSRRHGGDRSGGRRNPPQPGDRRSVRPNAAFYKSTSAPDLSRPCSR